MLSRWMGNAEIESPPVTHDAVAASAGAKELVVERLYPGCESKESEPKGPSFDFTPEMWSLPLNVKWNGGIMEYWVKKTGLPQADKSPT